jgi:hypothetical protein
MAGGAKLQDAATSGNGNAINCLGLPGRYLLTVIATGTISAGDVTWEQNPVSLTYAGTWAAVAPAVAPVQDTVIAVPYEGVLAFVRARISNNITGGGSVTVRLQTPVGDDVG